jgi:uncharacterized protein YdeI (YjbR/CyaY-like superfamily)
MAAKSQAKAADLETRTFASQQSWLAWLEKNHAKSPGLWLKFAKKGSGVPSVTYPEALEVALCYGWIDGQLKSLDATLLQAAFHAAPSAQQVVEDQLREGGDID